MAWLQVFCNTCGHHMDHKAKVETKGYTAIYLCPRCKDRTAIRTATLHSDWKKK
jgi:uncharacterized protein YlaI